MSLFILSGCSLAGKSKLNEQHHQSTILGYQYDQYPLKLKQGDKLTIYINSDKLDVILFSPINLDLQNGQQITISESGDYQLRVLLPRAFARRNIEVQYQLDIAVD